MVRPCVDYVCLVTLTGWNYLEHVLGVLEYATLGCPGGVTNAEVGMGQGSSRALHEEGTLAA